MKKKYSKEEKKEHVKIYKENILFYSPYLITIGLIVVELSTYLYKNGKIFISLNNLFFFLLIPIALIIFEYIDEIAGYLLILISGMYLYLTTIFIAAVGYMNQTHNYIMSMGLILMILGFISCFLFYKIVMLKIHNKNKLEIAIDKIHEQYNNLKIGTYIIGNYSHGFKDVEVNIPCIIYFDDKELKFIFAKDAERITKNIDIKLIKNVIYRNSSRLIQNRDAYLSLNASYFFAPTDEMQYTLLHSGMAYDVVANTKVDVIICWEIEIEYIENDEKKDFLLDVYENPEQFVSNIMKLINNE